MFYFGIPLLSAKTSKDWAKSVRLLNQTLGSVAQQTDQRFQCLIACHEIPAIREEYKRFVTFLPVESAVPTELAEMRRDKGRKKQEIAVHLRKAGGGYLMFLDADDLVHKNLVEYALKGQAPHGYIVKHGYMLYEGRDKIMPLNGNFDDKCGSCGIFHFTPEDLPATPEATDNYLGAFHKHRTFAEVAAAHGRPLAPIPFPAVIYFRNFETSISGRFFPEMGFRALKRRLKTLLIEKPLTEEIKKEFGLWGYG